MTALRATVDRIARALLAPGPAGRRRILTLWYGGTALMALLLAALGLLAVGLIEQAATEQFVRLGDDADQGPAFAAARQAERLLRPLLALQAERVEDELLQVTSPQALAQLFAETPDAVRLAAVTRLRTDSELVVTRRGSGWQVTERWSSPLPAAAAPEWYAAAPGPRWCAQYQHSDSGPLVLAFISGSQLAELTVAEAAARWLQVEGLAAARGFIVRDDGMVLVLGVAANPAANVAGPLAGGQPLPLDTGALGDLHARIRAGESGMRLVPFADRLWAVAYTPLHRLGGSYGLVIPADELSPELAAYRSNRGRGTQAAGILIAHFAWRLRVALLLLLLAAWFVSFSGGWIILRLLALRNR